MTVLESIQRSAEFLAKKGVESPRLQAELLLAHVLNLPRMKLYLSFERPLAAAEVEALRAAVKRRGLREPLQHIVGRTSFCGFELTVNRQVLVPRPETEMLAEMGWEFLNNLGSDRSPSGPPGESGKDRLPSGPPPGLPVGPLPRPDAPAGRPYQARALDFGTGSGCLAVALAAKCPAARVTALDVSAEALEIARQNLARHGLAGRVALVRSDGFAALPAATRFDLVVSNPPYVPTGEIESLQPEVRDFDPRPALDGGPDGLDGIRRLAAEAGAFLAAEGRLMLEFGDGQADAAREIFTGQNWIVEAVRADYTERPRFLIARRG